MALTMSALLLMPPAATIDAWLRIPSSRKRWSTCAIANSIGIPIKVSLPDFYVADRFSDTTKVYGDSIPTPRNPRLIGYPSSITRNDTIVKHYDSLLLDLNETNIPEILNIRPTRLTYSVSGEVDAPDPGGDAVNFVTSDSYFSVDIELILPLEGYASLMIMMDTLEFDFTTFYDKPPEEIESLSFLVNFENGFPVEVNSQMIFYRDGLSDADSIGPLFERGSFTVLAGIPDGSVCGVTPSKQTQLVEFTLDRIEEIAAAKYAIVWAGVSTYGFEDTPPRDVPLCQNHKFKTSIGVIVKANVNSADY